jgi:hypothetical protein
MNEDYFEMNCTPRASVMSLACAKIAESDLHSGAIMVG